MIQKRLDLLLIVFGTILLINSLYVSAITGSMGNARMILYPEVNGWTTTTIEKTILTKNVNDIPINIRLEVDEDGKKFLELVDTEFVLQPGEEKKAQFLVKVKKEGTYEGRINVFFSSLEGTGSNVVLSSTIIVIAKKDQGYQEIEDDEYGGETNVITGGVIDEDNPEKNFSGGIFLGISTIVLVCILGYLIFLISKKEKLNKVKIKRRKNE